MAATIIFQLDVGETSSNLIKSIHAYSIRIKRHFIAYLYSLYKPQSRWFTDHHGFWLGALDGHHQAELPRRSVVVPAESQHVGSRVATGAAGRSSCGSTTRVLP